MVCLHAPILGAVQYSTVDAWSLPLGSVHEPALYGSS